jgi:hypothetical protein
VTAHELAHDFYWAEYRSAVEQRDDERLQRLDLRSDGFAVLTLQAMGLNPERLASAALKMARFNQMSMIRQNAEDRPVRGCYGKQMRSTPARTAGAATAIALPPTAFRSSHLPAASATP